MYGRLSVLLTFLLVQPVLAGNAVVSSGEHPGFTRVVVQFDRLLPNWRTNATADEYQILFDTDEISFDLSRALRLIGRERIAGITAVEDGLAIKLACDCDVRVSTSVSAALVADVHPRVPGKPNAMDGIAAMLETPADGDAVQDVQIGSAPSMPRDAPASPGLPAVGELLLDQGLSLRDGARALLLDELAFPSPSQSTAVTLIGRQLSRAASQGLIEPDQNTAPRDIMRSADNLAMHDRANLSVTTSIDAAINPELSTVPPTENGAKCLSNTAVDVASWGDPSDVKAHGRFRAGAIAEDGSIDPSGALDLSRYYVAMGMGAEARVVARYLRENDRRLLTALADIMDRGRSDADILTGQVFCDGRVALWALLARPLPSDRPVSTDTILATFSALPPHLRTHLGPVLSERLRQAGLPEDVRQVVNAMTRGGDHTDRSELTSARLDLEGTKAERARGSLARLSNGTDLTAAEALLELLQDAEDRGLPPNPAWVLDDVPSLVRATEGTEVAAELNLAGLRGLIALGYFNAFRTAVAEPTPGLNADSRRELAALVLAKAVADGSDEDFLKTEIGMTRLAGPTDLERGLRYDIAQRLLSMGLPSRALAYISNDSQDPENVTVAANVYLALGQPETALSLLNETAEQSGLRGDAHLTAGDLASALPAYSKADRTSDALVSALRLGDWNWIATNGNDELASAVRVLNDPVPVPAEPESNGALIETSRELRAQARSLLQRTEPANIGSTFTN